MCESSDLLPEFAFRLNDGNVRIHTRARLAAFVDATVGKGITYKELIAEPAQ